MGCLRGSVRSLSLLSSFCLSFLSFSFSLIFYFSCAIGIHALRTVYRFSAIVWDKSLSNFIYLSWLIYNTRAVMLLWSRRPLLCLLSSSGLVGVPSSCCSYCEEYAGGCQSVTNSIVSSLPVSPSYFLSQGEEWRPGREGGSSWQTTACTTLSTQQ